MINRIQMSEQKNRLEKNIPSGNITPLSRNVPKENSNEKLKDLRRPRSGKYIRDLVELQELLSELAQLRRGEPVQSSDFNEGGNPGKHSISSTGKDPNPHFDTGHPQYEEVRDETEADIQSEIEAPAKEEMSWLSVGKEDFKDKVDKENYFSITDNDTYTPVNSRQQVQNPAISELEKRIQQKLDQLAQENPRISELLSMIYRSDKEEYLIGCGVINRPGTPVYSREDMAVGVVDPKEAQQLKRGYDLFNNYADNSNFLTLEIYIDAYCLIYRDGIVKTIV